MKKSPAFLLALVGATSVASAQTAEEHAAHHPDQQKAPATDSTRGAQASTSVAAKAQQNMQKMQALMVKIRDTKDVAERQRLLNEHQKAMRAQMDMMHEMGDTESGMMSRHADNGATDKGMVSGNMAMCSDMQTRMNMMQMMMEQMIAHAEAEHGH